MNPVQLVVFDGDDTLWEVEPLYDRAREAAAEVVAAAGLPAGRWESLERELDVANVARFGVSARRFPQSCLEAYRGVAVEAGQAVDVRVAARVLAAARSVHTMQAPLLPGAEAVLAELAARVPLVLLTKGDARVQRRRIAQSGLGRHFVRHCVTAQKTAAEFAAVLRDAGVPARAAWSVGNSLASDINPAVACGMRAIWIDAHVWEYERRELVPAASHVVAARCLLDVPAILGINRGLVRPSAAA